MKAHCSYEEKLKRDLRSYLTSGEAAKERGEKLVFKNAENLCDFIRKSHNDYLERKHGVEEDIHQIVDVNYKALAGMMDLLSEKREEFRLRHS